ncbi:hypothetical protein NFO65_22370 [Neorhizobium galegae]|uniref:hypothetical protein n=1 Tax=Neorhizobium galegae TaxID=399 RepID=UPI002101B488|nr:hypothetical protein [Neorhizobium galegae]MCQ1573475.1 hypothetical protein [Neorhizobium galegae]
MAVETIEVDAIPGLAQKPRDWTGRNPEFAVNDLSFFEYVDRLKRLRNFLYQEAIPISGADAASLEMGNLHVLYFHADGRMPAIEEWNQVERQTQFVYSILSPMLRRKFLLIKTPRILVVLPVVFLILIITSAVAIVGVFNFSWQVLVYVAFFLFWTGSLGSLGAIASIGMNALSVQSDITFDITNAGLLALRVIIGALFALVLLLPFGYNGLFDFFYSISFLVFKEPNATDSSQTSLDLIGQGVLLLAPFVLGFSTSTVILILNQLTDAVQSLFGHGRRQEGQDALVTRPAVRVSEDLLTVKDKRGR